MFNYINRRQYDGNIFAQPNHVVKGNEWLVQRMSLLHAIDTHRGCVNTVVWNSTGELLLSGSDDQHLVLSDPWKGKCITRVHTAHRANIFSAKFLPNSSDARVVSCSGDGVLIYTDLEKIEETRNCKFACHSGTCYDVLTLPDDPYTFLTCGEDGTVRWFDLRMKNQCVSRSGERSRCSEDVLLNMQKAVTAIAVNPVVLFHLAVATQDSTIRIFDRRMLGTRASDSYLEDSTQALMMKLKPENLASKNQRVTSLRYNSLGTEILASYSSDYLYLFDIQNCKEVPVEVSGELHKNSGERDSAAVGPTLKRLRLRGDWSDTGPQAIPESELRNQPGDVGQVRPTLHSTLMQRMTDVLTRMLQSPRGNSSRPTVEARRLSVGGEAAEVENIPSGSEEHQEGAEGSEVDHDLLPCRVTTRHLSSEDLFDGGGPHEQPEAEEPVSEMDTSAADLQQPCGQDDLKYREEPVGGQNVPEGEQPSPMQVEPLADRVCCDADSQQAMEVDSGSALPELSEPSSSHTMQREGAQPEVHSEQTDSDMCLLSERSRETRTHSDSELESHHPLSSVDTENTSRSDESLTDISRIQDTLSSLRRNFVDRHAIEPAIDLLYSSEGVSGGLMTLGIGDEISRTYSAGMSDDVEDDSEPPRDPSILKHKDSTGSPLSSKPAEQLQAEVSQSSVKAPAHDEVPGSSVRVRLSFDSSVQCSDGKSSPKRLIHSSDEESEEELSLSPGGHKVHRVKSEERRHSDVRHVRIVYEGCVLQQYRGHRNARTMIKEAGFWGDSHVMSGSDCGRVFIWEKKTGRLVMLWEADRHVVNCLQPHPTLPVLATSGIDYDIKLWAPLSAECNFDEDKAAEITRRNEALLEETRDTITVPATFMIRMLATLNQIRQDRLRTRNQNQEEDE